MAKTVEKTVNGHTVKLADLKKGDEVLLMSIIDGSVKKSFGVYELSAAGVKQLQIITDDGKVSFNRVNGLALSKKGEAEGLRVFPRGCQFAVNLLGE